MRTVAGLLVAVACVVVAGCGGGEDSGDLIVFSSDRDGDFEIFVMNADGTEVRQLTYNDKVDVSPSWSLDGERIAFTSDRDGDFEIFVMNADGTEVRQLTYNDNMDYRPTWFEDGKHFYFVSDRGDPGGEGEVFMMNADKFVEPTEPDEDSKETLRELAEKTGSTEEELEAAIKKSIEDLLGPNYGEQIGRAPV